MTIQTIDRGTAGDTGDKFKIGVALDVCQANDDYLNLIKVGTVATFAAITSMPLAIGQVIETAGHTNPGLGGRFFIGKAGTKTPGGDGGTYNSSATTNVYASLINPYELSAYDFGATGVAAADTAAITAALASLRANGRGGVLTIPSTIAVGATVGALALTNGLSICIIDQRIDRIEARPAFGLIEYYVEGRDSGGNYASEIRVKGKQNPAFSMAPVSDGTANGFLYANNMTSLLGLTNTGDNNYQILSDPYSHGRIGDIGIMQYAAGTGSVSFAAYFGVDSNNKTRVDIAPINLTATSVAITGISNTTPIVVTTTTPHGCVGAVVPVSFSATDVAALNGTSWLATNTGASTLTLLNSVASGGGGAAGNISVQVNSQRATLNVPAVQGGTEALYCEGKAVTKTQFVSEAAQGTAPVSASSQTVDVNLHARPYLLNTIGAQAVSGTPGSGGAKVVDGTAVIGGGGTVTVTLTNDAIFTSLGSMKVTGGNTTGANAWYATKSSTSSIIFTGTPGDQIDFHINGF